MKIILDIPDENIAQNVIWFLRKLQASIDIKLDEIPESYSTKSTCHNNEYVKKHWKDFIMSTESIDYYKSENYRTERGKYLLEKYS